jgi:hypothetical protein
MLRLVPVGEAIHDTRSRLMVLNVSLNAVMPSLQAVQVPVAKQKKTPAVTMRECWFALDI